MIATNGGCRRFGLVILLVSAWIFRGLAMDDELADMVSERSDAQIVDLVRSLDSIDAPRADAARTSAVCLGLEHVLVFHEGRYWITENAIYRIVDARSATVGQRHRLYDASEEIDSVGAWLLRNSEVIRAQKRDIHVIKGNDSRPTEVVGAIADLRDGDVVGWSIRRGQKRTHPGTIVALWDEVPVRSATLDLRSDGWVAYRMVGRNLRPGSFEIDRIDGIAGEGPRYVAQFRDLEQVTSEPFAPPPLTVHPAVFVNWRGAFDARIRRWLYVASWNEASYYMELELGRMLERDGQLKKTARRLTEGSTGPRAKLDVLHDFVRDEVVPVSAWELLVANRPAKDVLASRTANNVEAGALLCALARAVDLSVRPVFVRSLDLGPIDEANPGFLQFSDLVVESLDDPGRYYAPHCSDCPPGTLPPDLRHATAMTIEDDIASRWRDVIKDVYSTVTTDDKRLVDIFDQTVARKRWCTMLTTPGDPNAAAGVLREDVLWQAGEDTATIELSFDLTSRSDDVASDDLAIRSRLAEHRARRILGGEEHDDDGSVVQDSGRIIDTLPVDVPGQEGDLWLLAADRLLVTRLLPEWQGPGRGPFHVTESTDQVLVARIALPAGWRLETIPEPLVAVDRRFVARGHVEYSPGEIMITRHYQMIRGTTLRPGLEDLDAAINRVRQFEQMTLVLVREQGDGPGR